MASPVKQVFGLTIALVAGALLAFGGGVAAEREQAQLPLDDLRTFSEVFAKIKNDYVEKVDDKALLENAIKGMLAGLDPHSSYLLPADYQELQAGTSGEFGGLGIEVGMEDGFVKVVTPIDDTPAQRAGVKAGDLIIKIDGTPVKGMGLNGAVKLMRGKPGTEINLTVVREGKEKPFEIVIVRDVIKVTSVKRRTLEKGFGYVRITQFQSRTGESLREAISKLKEDNDDSLKGLVLDLRNNPGGVLSAAVSVSDAFLSKGIIVYTEGRLEEAQLRYNAKPTDILKGAPMVVLVNAGSASASEIVAGALKDHSRAVIMGTRTFGKGSVQTILPMDNGSALKLTTARYFTPSGVSIQAKGIDPDIKLDAIKIEQAEQDTARIKEADLAGHLDNGDKPVAADKPAADASKGEGSKAKTTTPSAGLAQSDYPVYEALNLLKGMAILNRKHG